MDDADRSRNPRTEAPVGRAAKRGSRRADAALALLSAALSVLAIEIGYRVAFGLPLTEWPNWRIDNTVILDGRDVIVPDPHLGWKLKANNSSPGHHTLEHGIRRNSAETAVRPGAILAVGDSFTEGWEVEDEETWPAHLEKRIGKPVLNAGVGGYGTDQIVMRAEQLLPILKPKTLIVGFLEFDIHRANHTHFGSPKPYFTVENDVLKQHPPALLTPRCERGFLVAASYGIRDALGHLASIDFLLSRVAPDFWYGSERREYRKAPNDPVRVTCLLLGRLKKQVDAAGVRMILFMQYYANAIMADDDPPAAADRVVTCAEALGVEVVDQFASLRALVAADRDALRAYYMTDGKNYSHMSGRGNEHAAGLLAKVLGE